MGILGSLFGGGKDRTPRSAREALPLAQEQLQTWERASSAKLCCVYTSAEDAGYPPEKDGRSRAWHFDFLDQATGSIYLVRVADGKAKGWEHANPSHPVEYVFALYDGNDAGKGFPTPRTLPEDWLDSVEATGAVQAAFEREMAGLDPGIKDDYFLMALCAPGAYLRHACPACEPLLLPPPPAEASVAGLMCHIDIDLNDALAVYLDAAAGTELGCERFRFPPNVMLGASADW